MISYRASSTHLYPAIPTLISNRHRSSIGRLSSQSEEVGQLRRRSQRSWTSTALSISRTTRALRVYQLLIRSSRRRLETPAGWEHQTWTSSRWRSATSRLWLAAQATSLKWGQRQASSSSNLKSRCWNRDKRRMQNFSRPRRWSLSRNTKTLENSPWNKWCRMKRV